MTIDIVERLRKGAHEGDVPFYMDDSGEMIFHTETMEEAADLIVSLSRQLDEALAEGNRYKQIIIARENLKSAGIDADAAAMEVAVKFKREAKEARNKGLEEAAMVAQVIGHSLDHQGRVECVSCSGEIASAIRSLKDNQP